MWPATAKYFAAQQATPPPFTTLLDQLGTEGAIRYNRLAGEYPEIELGPDGDILDHYKKLQRAKQQSTDEAVAESAAIDAGRQERNRERDSRPAPQRADWKKPKNVVPDDLPKRTPNYWMTPDAKSRGFGPELLPHRTPGEAMQPTYAPAQQSSDAWQKWLGDRGVTLENEQVPGAARPAPEHDYRPLRGPENWADLTHPDTSGKAVPTVDDLDAQNLKLRPDLGRPSWIDRARKLWGGGRTASTEVTSYIDHVLVAVGGTSKDRALEGWDREDSGSGVSYTKRIGDRVHVLNSQPDGWIHNSGPSADEMSDNPRMYDTLGEAMLRAHSVGDSYRAKPPTEISKMNSRAGA